MIELLKHRQTYLLEKELAEILNVHVQTLRNWRFQRRGPEYLKFGSAVRYDPMAVLDYLQSATVRAER
ncbi:hypothetical protein DSCO28_64690 [Desulfosarcina ovata subsp. sediminis]|uniref:Helix-turn-helix domain-containing protein n=1 Tax=Desulfosarcina ovata subsp. sediminis TaxID=885957 RepID=A0A5K8A069_9BACT|nr:helix-turn-helix domain-containing protein [Desulfosarcina ovata]BBO85903.1 hypothetical protein DSCO28_64690 [Desulfosarcina ovata subsp. sediminis]